MLRLPLALALGARLTNAFDNGAPHSRLPALGWSSWVALGPGDDHPVFDYCDENSVKAAADAFMEVGLYEAGYRHLHLDDCWAATERNATGFPYPELDHFPNGMKPVIDYVHSKGNDGDKLVFGLYTCGGTKTCVGGRVGSENHWTQDAQAYAEWGVDWVKMDWCNSAPQDPKNTYPKMGKALNESGRHIAFNMCEWGKENPWEWGDACAQSWRATGDHTGTWSSTKSIISEVMKIPKQYSGKPYGWNDMDMLETGNGLQAAHANGREGNMNLDESITEFSMWAISASPLVVTTPIFNCSASQLAEDIAAKAAAAVEIDTEGPTGERRSTVDSNPEAKIDDAAKCTISLTKQRSTDKCVEGQSFGCSGTVANMTMWTKGCRGVFACNGVTDVVCDIDGNGVHTCPCKKGNKPDGPPPPGPPNPVKHNCKGVLNEVQKIVLLNKDVIAINQDSTPQGFPVVGGDSTVWARHLTGGDVAVALYNEGDAAKSIGATFASLGWSATTKATVKDLWGAHSAASPAVATTATAMIKNVTVRAHSTVVLRLTKA